MQNHTKHGKATASDLSHYRQLFVMLVLSAIAMFAFMYGMVDRFANVYANLNQLYMVLVMVAPMAIIELLVMRSMYSNRRLNAAILAGSTVVLVASWVLLRGQTGIGDRQFLRSMIPHHAGAILMCEQATLTDPDVHQLCAGIVKGQQSEIELMRAKLITLRGGVQ
jgi:hypothetical protein